MRACSRVALVLMVLSESFGLAGCAAIDDLKFAIAQWFESARFPDGVLPDNDLPNATPMIPPDKIPKEAATKPSEKMPKAARKLQRPQTVKLQEKPPTSDSTEAVRPEETEGQIRAACDVAIAHPLPRSAAARNFFTLRSAPGIQQGLDSEGFRSAPRTG